MSFASLGLRAELLRALDDAGYTTPTPVQSQTIPVILSGRDVLAGAQTGTGKTASFALPLLQRLAMSAGRSAGRRPVRGLILVPTRELAAQVEESIKTYGKYMPLTSTAIFGGVNINPQLQALRRGVDILVATPGRLLDHVQQRTVDLSRIEILVLDEADRMLDMGFVRDIRRILAILPATRQNLLFSATFSNDIKALADGFLNSPARIEVERKNTESDLITQSIYCTSKDSKRDLLVWVLAEQNIKQALVFTRTKHGADRLAKQLIRDGIVAAPIHGDRSQAQRMRALADFKAGAVRILVATDLAARGLDIDMLPHVVNFELPSVAEDYVHRVGRTGRAGIQGEAISLVAHDEMKMLADIERLIKKRIVRKEAVGFVPAVSAERAVSQPPRMGASQSSRGLGAPAPSRRGAYSAGPNGWRDNRRPVGR
jgi:ATP-dependent RNA helicase RhlE